MKSKQTYPLFPQTNVLALAEINYLDILLVQTIFDREIYLQFTGGVIKPCFMGISIFACIFDDKDFVRFIARLTFST